MFYYQYYLKNHLYNYHYPDFAGYANYVAFIIPLEGRADQFAISIYGSVMVIKWDGISVSAGGDRHVYDIEIGNRMCDAKADPHCRIVCGVMPPTDFLGKLEHKAEGNLYRYIDGDCEAPVLIVDKIGLPNGFTWNEGEKKFYFIDSLAFDVREYDYDGETGNVGMFSPR